MAIFIVTELFFGNVVNQRVIQIRMGRRAYENPLTTTA